MFSKFEMNLGLIGHFECVSDNDVEEKIKEGQDLLIVLYFTFINRCECLYVIFLKLLFHSWIKQNE